SRELMAHFQRERPRIPGTLTMRIYIVEQRARDRPRVGPRRAHLGVGGAARLQVTRPARIAPADETAVATVLGRPVHRLERVGERRADEGLEVAVGLIGEQEVLRGPGRGLEVDAEG